MNTCIPTTQKKNSIIFEVPCVAVLDLIFFPSLLKVTTILIPCYVFSVIPEEYVLFCTIVNFI